MNYQPKKVLVTGGAGFIGSHFIYYLLRNKTIQTVVNVDCLTYAANLDNLESGSEDPRYIFEQVNINDTAKIEFLLRHYNIDTIVHFAAESHVDRSISGPRAFVETNVLGTFSLLVAAKKVWLDELGWNDQQCRFHHVSTDEVYGSLSLDDTPATEENPYRPNSPYSASKAGSDHWVRAYNQTYGLPTTISNCSNNYGPFQHAEKLIPTVIRNAVLQQPIPIYGTGQNIRDWLFVGDHCDAIYQIITRAATGENYNISANNELTNLVLAQHICKLLDQRIPENTPHSQLIHFVTDRAGHDFRYALNANKIQRDLDWRAQTSFKQGLIETIDYELEVHVGLCAST